jgi:hypothetical protein
VSPGWCYCCSIVFRTHHVHAHTHTPIHPPIPTLTPTHPPTPRSLLPGSRANRVVRGPLTALLGPAEAALHAAATQLWGAFRAQPHTAAAAARMEAVRRGGGAGGGGSGLHWPGMSGDRKVWSSAMALQGHAACWWFLTVGRETLSTLQVAVSLNLVLLAAAHVLVSHVSPDPARSRCLIPPPPPPLNNVQGTPCSPCGCPVYVLWCCPASPYPPTPPPPPQALAEQVAAHGAAAYRLGDSAWNAYSLNIDYRTAAHLDAKNMPGGWGAGGGEQVEGGERCNAWDG